ncbi:hypothetical protein HII31_02283 [Pseudocercospora fuligena]|uniref:DUF7730 domain-containing protein n=1 Tax=Pseudocercospora fuligena TaxID=685502 RepID=A0A8H6RPR4_9PEZI|nr:hypothetical protein HII31_02283 [Pseudocercospora fuligena]
MASRRAKAATTNTRSSKLMERESIPPGYISPGNSSFLRKLPREIRDKIYDELLIVHRTPEDEDKYGKIQAGLKTGNHEYELERELDFMLQDYALIPDSSEPNIGMKYIGKNKSILLACKQIYEEATTTLFGKNIFAACPQSERVCSFWRCSIYCGCVPKDRPCLARPENFVKIKQLFMIISGDESDEQVRNLKTNLRTIVDTIQQSGNKLQLLKIRYWSQFGGEVEGVRDDLEGPLHPRLPERPPVMIRHAFTGKFHTIKASEVNAKLFRNISILEPLKKLKGVVDYVDIRGDLPRKYIDQLKRILTSLNPGKAALEMEKAKAEAASNKRPKPVGGLAGFIADFIEKDPNMSAERKAYYQRLTKTSSKSPAVMAQLLDNSPFNMPGPSSAQQASGATTDAPFAPSPAVDVPAPGHTGSPATVGGIGFLNGKPLFGPPRPPPTL